MYQASVITVDKIVDHPNADRLNLLVHGMEQYVVGKNTKVGDLVILFPADGQINHKFLSANNLYRESELNEDKTKSGFFDVNRRVRQQPFRGQRSYGFMASPEMFSCFGKIDFKPNTFLTTIGKELVCEKYYSKATLARRARNLGSKLKNEVLFNLKKHFDTPKFSHMSKIFPNKGLFIITEKIHGSSARTGYVNVRRKNKFPRSLFSKYRTKWEHVSGTRNTVLENRGDINPNSGERYRIHWHHYFSERLLKGETVFYEIAGFDSNNSPIMNTQSTLKLKDKSVMDKFGENIIYDYGVTSGQRIFVYRITTQNEDGDVIELPWEQVKQRCKELEVDSVPELDVSYLYDGLSLSGEPTHEILERLVKFFTEDQKSTVANHLMEGVCVRCESEHGMKVMKEKSFLFGILEGYLKEKDDYVDVEEAS